MTKFTPSILIITALEEEFEAAKILLYYRTKVSQDLIDTIISSEGDEHKGVFKCVFGQIPSSDGGWHEVLLSQISRMGNTPAAARTGILLQKFESIKYVFMVGIAGGIPNLSKPEDYVRLGDIIISESVIEYDNLKIESLRYNKLKPYSNNIIKTLTSGCYTTAKRSLYTTLPKDTYIWPVASANILLKDDQTKRPSNIDGAALNNIFRSLQNSDTTTEASIIPSISGAPRTNPNPKSVQRSLLTEKFNLRTNFKELKAVESFNERWLTQSEDFGGSFKLWNEFSVKKDISISNLLKNLELFF